MQDILVGAMQLRVAAEMLHPLYTVYLPSETAESICTCPGIVVSPDAFFVPRANQIILQAEVQSLQ